MAKADWTPIGIGEVQLEHCFGWASSLFGRQYKLKENDLGGSAPYIVDITPRSHFALGCNSMMDTEDIVCALQGQTTADLYRFIKIPRWANVSLFAKRLRERRLRDRQAAKAECEYMVANAARIKESTKLFFDQGA